MLSAKTSEFPTVEGLGIDAVRVDATNVIPSEWYMRKPLVEHLQTQFEKFVASNEQLRATVRTLDSLDAPYYAYGGWVRDHLTSIPYVENEAIAAKDIDLVVEKVSGEQLGLLINPPYRRTIFGGYACDSGAKPFDIWALNDTFLIRGLRLSGDLPTLLRVTDFNINAVIFSPANARRGPRLLDGGCLKALELRTIDFQGEVVPFPVLQAARLLIYGTKLRFSFSERVSRFIRNVAETSENRRTIQDGVLSHAPRYAKDAISLLQKMTDNR